jgi:hypothetical protein
VDPAARVAHRVSAGANLALTTVGAIDEALEAELPGAARLAEFFEDPRPVAGRHRFSHEPGRA